MSFVFIKLPKIFLAQPGDNPRIIFAAIYNITLVSFIRHILFLLEIVTMIYW